MNEGKGDKTMQNTSSAVQMDFNNLDEMFGGLFDNPTPEEPEATTEEEVTQKELTPEEEENLKDAKKVAVDETKAILEKMSAISKELNKEFVEREELINIMLISVVTSSNLLMLGPPGSAKTLLCKELCSHIDNSHFFEWLLNKTSDPSELLGSFSIKGMENDEFKRITSGKLPEANIAFIDEVYKCNSPTLNALLSIMNEHIFYNDGKAIPVPLISLFAASNEPPEDESLLAMHDRFLFKINVDYIHNASNKKKMYNNYIFNRAGKKANKSFTTVSIDEIDKLQERAKKTPVSKEIINAFISLTKTLFKEKNISVSDRRSNECFKVLQGSAVINGRDRVSLEDFGVLKYVLADNQSDLEFISSEISKIMNPYDDRFERLKSQFEEIQDKLNNAPTEDDRNQLFFQYQNSLKSLTNKTNKLIFEASNSGRDLTEYNTFRDSVKDYTDNLAREVLGQAVGGASDATVDANGDILF